MPKAEPSVYIVMSAIGFKLVIVFFRDGRDERDDRDDSETRDSLFN